MYLEFTSFVVAILTVSALEVMAIYKIKHLALGMKWVMKKLNRWLEEDDEPDISTGSKDDKFGWHGVPPTTASDKELVDRFIEECSKCFKCLAMECEDFPIEGEPLTEEGVERIINNFALNVRMGYVVAKHAVRATEDRATGDGSLWHEPSK